MNWRVLSLVLAVSLSVLIHYHWLTGSDKSVKRLTVSGGAEPAPMALRVSLSQKAKTQKSQSLEAEHSKKNTQTIERLEKIPSKKVLEKKPVVEKNIATKEHANPEKVKPQVTDTAPIKSAELDKNHAEEITQARVKESTVVGLENLPVVYQADFKTPPKPPHYPALSLRKRHQGEAIIRALVNSDGAVEQLVLVESSGHRLLDKSAMAAVGAWNFVAARVDKQPVTAWIEVPVEFRIN